MEERKRASYFEVIDLVDRILPSKEEEDYTQIHPKSLVERFDRLIKESGFYFDSWGLNVCKEVIKDCFAKIYGRRSFVIETRDRINREGGVDKNNYEIQNQLSQAKTKLILNLADVTKLPSYESDGLIDTSKLGTVDELRTRMSKEKIEDYIYGVLFYSWESSDITPLDDNSLIRDILLHFGINDYGNKPNNNLYYEIRDEIKSLAHLSRSYYGSVYEKPYLEELKLSVEKIAGYINEVLRDSLSKADTREGIEIQTKREVIERTMTDSQNQNSTQKTVPLEELENPIAIYEELQAIAAENIRLANECKALEDNLQAQIAEKKARIAENNARIQSLISK